ncbi:hypothetical protein [Parabacteroides distasonis]|uniref:hypothetical protein n=1 Tax=Parabacteroides distasonis TaxID=823 RepID=UPI00189E3C0B|nr:hypothetical protein [Parabacteroides distasonis]MDB9153875.1 hypothetical protein [Parabacteroides distasonis]MDB9158294.1 hypothetical protein [Parabacteroides distasonis]MDB9167110.1 hypothetical protein [Parabacteroides distasonis]MDB9171579.1 hypothetical protein [Parabacteroides distasonis]MDB9193914.1 hypothetical protein [Parabacteroides distasonis]
MHPGRYQDVAGQVRERTRTGTDVRPGEYEDTSGRIHVRTRPDVSSLTMFLY